MIDLGSGAGFDVFLAAKAVGSTGKVIGVDMNKASVICSDHAVQPLTLVCLG